MSKTQKNAQAGVGGRKHLLFSLGEDVYAMDLLEVREVVALPDTTRIPQTPAYFLGIMNLRGEVISVFDLRKKLSAKFGDKNTSETAVIICDFPPMQFGVVVSSVNSVISIRQDEISETPDTIHGNHTEYIAGVVRKEQQLVLLLNIAKALNVEDKRIVNKVSGDKIP